ncbi:hypothetical protein Btru_065319 [Bulinus truncatus]|nr:hypothetical protein Btru_065319 [Bulinus truncatus]
MDYILNPFDYRVGSDTLASGDYNAENISIITQRKKTFPGIKFNREKNVLMKMISRSRQSNIEEIVDVQSKCKNRGKRPLTTTLLERKEADRKTEGHFTEGQKKMKINVTANDSLQNNLWIFYISFSSGTYKKYERVVESIRNSDNLSNGAQKMNIAESIRNSDNFSSELQRMDCSQKVSYLDSNKEGNILKVLQPSIYVDGFQNTSLKKSSPHRKLSQKNLFDCFFKQQKMNIKDITNNEVLATLNIPVADTDLSMIVSTANDVIKQVLPSMNSSLSEVDSSMKVINLGNEKVSPVVNIKRSPQKKLKKRPVLRQSKDVQSNQIGSDFQSNKNITKVLKPNMSSDMSQRKSERLRKKKTLDRTNDIIPNMNSLVRNHLPSWRFLYPVQFLRCSKNSVKNSSLCGELMSSARELDFLDGALSFGVPFPDYVPGIKLLKELVCLLLSSDERISCQANSYVQSWLRLHPPVLSRTIKMYLEVFNFHSYSVDFFERIQENIKQQNYLSILWIFDFCVSLFEINWNYCRQKNTMKDLKQSMIASWLWQSPFDANCGETTKSLLKTLKDIMLIPDLILQKKLHLCTSVSSLIALAAECIRLANVHWNLFDPTFNKDPVITVACHISEIILMCQSEMDFNTMIAVIHSIEPDWLRALVVASVISDTHSHFMGEKFSVKSFSWCNIVSHFFHLSPALQLSKQTNTDSHKHHFPENADLKLASRVNKKNGKGESQVHIACKRNNHKKLQELLLTPGVNINLACYAGWTPLHEACHHGSLDCVNLLLHTSKMSDKNSRVEQIDINAVGPSGFTPLMEAVEKNHVDICKALLKCGGRVLLFIKNEQDQTAFDLAKTEEMRAVLNDLYDEPLIDETSTYISYKECSEYLKLLSLLLTSCYSCMSTFPEIQNDSQFCNPPEDFNVLKNILTDFKKLKNYFEKLTRYDDYRMLQQIDFKCMELILHELVPAF